MSHEIKRRKVVLASVLKPVDDTRMLEKIGATLAASGEFEVYIVAYPSSAKVDHPNIHTFHLPHFKRTSFKRLIIPWIVYGKINQIKPETIIINTPELLLVAVLNKLLFGRKLVYDVLENYYRNIRYGSAYPKLVRPLIAAFTRITEILLAPFINQFLLAEKGYANELGFARAGVILENKLPEAEVNKHTIAHKAYFNLVFSGTLARTTGVFEAIELCKRLHAINPSYHLTLIGYCALPEVLHEIQQKIKDFPFITLRGGNSLVPHSEILSEISRAGTGIIIYPANRSTESSIPTKLYEYLALKLPVLISHTEPSNKLVHDCNAGIVLPHEADYAALNEQLATGTFSFNLPESIYWENQKLLSVLNNL